MITSIPRLVLIATVGLLPPCLGVTRCGQGAKGGEDVMVTGSMGTSASPSMGAMFVTGETWNPTGGRGSQKFLCVLFLETPPSSATQTESSTESSDDDLVDQGAGIVRITGDPFVFTYNQHKQTATLNKLTIDLRNGTVLVARLDATGTATLLDQERLAVPYDKDLPKVVDQLRAQSKTLQRLVPP